MHSGTLCLKSADPVAHLRRWSHLSRCFLTRRCNKTQRGSLQPVQLPATSCAHTSNPSDNVSAESTEKGVANGRKAKYGISCDDSDAQYRNPSQPAPSPGAYPFCPTTLVVLTLLSSQPCLRPPRSVPPNSLAPVFSVL